MRTTFSNEVRWLLKQARPYRPLYAGRLSTVVIASLIVLIEPLILKWLIDDVLPWRKTSMLAVAAVGYFAAYTFQFGFNSLGFILDSYITNRIMFDIRLKLLRHLQRLSPGYFLKTSTGDLLHRLEQDVDQIQELGGNFLASLLRISVMTTSTLVILSVLSWRLTVCVVPLVPLMILLRRYGQPRLRGASDRTQQANAKRVAFFQDHLTAMPQIQLLNRTAGERRRFAAIGRQALDAMVRRRSTELVLGFATNLNFVVGTAIVLGLGGLQVLNGTLTVGGMVAFYTYLSRIFGPLEAVVTLYAGLQRANASARRLLEILNVRPEIVDPPRPAQLPRTGSLDVELAGVFFSYKPDQPVQPVLQDLDLSIRAGEKVALVGMSGCGKSTVARLLTRMYDPERGQVEIAGVDVRDLELRALRRLVALVPQDPILFGVSLRENLLYGNPRASDSDLRKAVRTAQLEEMVHELPGGWAEPVGPRGERLSGGQRQRVAVARAILQDPRLLILDEATSALDGLTERRLLKALDPFVRERTTILIAHRLSAILWADRIILLDQGRVVDEGIHPDLYRRCGLYRELCERQLKGDEPLESAGAWIERGAEKVVAS
ncbi:MAG TPA: ABC transporter ATP-binding protein [Thermoanaerobaculia bacterium]|nr:ABC transporter ATP-binding protein [Thermoanaerobaculia bacterium]